MVRLAGREAAAVSHALAALLPQQPVAVQRDHRLTAVILPPRPGVSFGVPLTDEKAAFPGASAARLMACGASGTKGTVRTSSPAVERVPLTLPVLSRQIRP